MVSRAFTVLAVLMLAEFRPLCSAILEWCFSPFHLTDNWCSLSFAIRLDLYMIWSVLSSVNMRVIMHDSDILQDQSQLQSLHPIAIA